MRGLKELRQAAADLKAQIDQRGRDRARIGERAVAETRGMTDDERTSFVAIGQELDILRGQQAETMRELQTAEHANEAERRGEAMIDSDAVAAQRALARAGISPGAAMLETGTGRLRPCGPQAVQMFGAAAATLDGWESPGEYLRCVGRGLHDTRLRAESQSGAEPSLGGFLIPGQLWGEVLDSSLESEIVRPRASIFPMLGRDLDVACWDDLDRSGGTIANVELQFPGEGTSATPQVAKLRALKLHARKGMIFCEAPNELIADAPSFDRNLTALLARALSFGFDNRFLFGDGSTGPLGALVAPCTIVIARDAAGDITYDDLVEMFSRMTPGSIPRSVWVASPSTIPKLATLSIVIGTSGSHVPVMTQADGRFYILTREVVFTEKAKALGTQSDISLCDLTSYAIGLRREASLDRSAHVGFQRDVETYRLQARLDGQPMLASAITPLNGSTLSPFVTLGDAA